MAYASFYKMDLLLTWNCNHLANANKKQHISIINTRLKLFTPEPFYLQRQRNDNHPTHVRQYAKYFSGYTFI
ncbi:MAG: hypothetical protein KAI83_06230 [Thiomargarita sp.]|nr:hypothetical protein [Thiomargarita sp.]